MHGEKPHPLAIALVGNVIGWGPNQLHQKQEVGKIRWENRRTEMIFYQEIFRERKNFTRERLEKEKNFIFRDKIFPALANYMLEISPSKSVNSYWINLKLKESRELLLTLYYTITYLKKFFVIMFVCLAFCKTLFDIFSWLMLNYVHQFVKCNKNLNKNHNSWTVTLETVQKSCLVSLSPTHLII